MKYHKETVPGRSYEQTVIVQEPSIAAYTFTFTEEEARVLRTIFGRCIIGPDGPGRRVAGDIYSHLSHLRSVDGLYDEDLTKEYGRLWLTDVKID